MIAVSGPVQLDREIVYEERSARKKPLKKRSGLPIFAGTGVLLAIALLLYQPGNSTFVDTPPPEEQAERDSVASAVLTVQAFIEQSDSLPEEGDIRLPTGYVFTREEEGTWSIESPGGLYYTSDMDINAFRTGEI